MTTHDGTQERTLQPPDDSLSDAEMRACERAAREGFDARDARFMSWLAEQIADTPTDISSLVTGVLGAIYGDMDARFHVAIVHGARFLRDRYIAECAEEYWGDLIEQEKYAQEP